MVKDPLVGYPLSDTNSLAYSLATNKILREQILHHAPQGSGPLWLIPYIEKQMELVQKSLQKDFEQLKKVHRETLLSHPDCYGLLLKDLEVHASLAGMVEENS